MRYHILLCWAALLLTGPVVAQTPVIKVAPPLKNVVVYLNGTALEHQGTLNLKAGLNQVQLMGLSSRLDMDAMEVDLGEGVELVSVSNANEEEEEGSQPVAPKSAVDSLALLTESKQRLEAELLGLQQEKSFLLANQALPSGTQANWALEVQRGAALMRTRLAAIQLETIKLQAQQAVIQRQTALVEPRAKQTVTTNQPLLVVQARQAGSVPVAVRYYVTSRSSWRPKLDIRADAMGRELQFITHGTLINKSGVDWTKVRVVLMRHALSDDLEHPDLEPWALDFDGGDHIGEGRVDEYVVKGTAKGKPVAVAQSTRYEVPEPVTLVRNGRQELMLPKLQLAGQPEYLAVPRLAQEVFMQAKVSGWQGLQLPERASVYHQGVYVGTTEIDERAYNDSLEIVLGHDDQLVVGRAKLEDFSGDVPLSDKRRVRLAYELNVRNNHSEAVRLRLLDQIPISEEKEISVKLLEASGAKLEERTGKLTWILTLPPGANQRLRFSFQVDYPKGKSVELINHRVRISSPKFR